MSRLFYVCLKTKMPNSSAKYFLFFGKHLKLYKYRYHCQQGKPRIEQQEQTRHGEQELEGIHRIEERLAAPIAVKTFEGFFDFPDFCFSVLQN